MAHDREFFINSDKETFKRYDLARFLEQGDDSLDPLTSSMLDNIDNLAIGGYYTIQGEDGMPWLISERLYGDSQYWWIIMLFNGFQGIEDIKNGEDIKYPSVNALQDFYFKLKSRERTSE